MKRCISFLSVAVLILGSNLLHAQFGAGGSPSPGISGELLKLFGEHKGFTAGLEFQIRQDGASDPMTLPGNIAFLEGKTRFEMDLTLAKGGQIPAQALGQLKQMGMDKMVMISLPKKALSYLIYPGLEAYIEQPIRNPDAQESEADFEMEIVELGKEEVAGHNCNKNKVTVTDKEGAKHESTVWNATDLKNFPVKIQTTENGNDIALLFSDVKLTKPAADLFAPPSTYTKYGDTMGMMEAIMMRRMNEAGGMPSAK